MRYVFDSQKWRRHTAASAYALIVWAAMFCSGTAAEEVQSDLLLAPGDNLKLDILDDQKDPVDLPVGTDGRIQAPLLGGVPVAGLSISQALQELEKRYREEQIFVTPRIALSVVAYRPIYVLGDVRNPGSYPFQPDLTVEKALGLAGGQSSASGSDNPVVLAARLQAELEVAGTGIVRAALAIARLAAQLDGETEIPPENIPEEARAYMTGAIAETFREVELDILRSDAANTAAKKKMLNEGIEEAEKGQALLENLTSKTAEGLAFSRSELERAKALQAKGIKTVTEVAAVAKQLMIEEARELQVLANLSEGRRGLLQLKRQLAEIEELRQVKALTDLRIERSNLAKSLAERHAVEQQLALLTGRSMDAFRTMRELVLDFAIRRGSGSRIADIEATSTTAIMPGDVLLVKTRNPGEAVAAVPSNVPLR